MVVLALEDRMTLTTRLERIPTAEVRLAEDSAALLQAMGIIAVHLLASPGAGKTCLVRRTVESLAGRLRPGIIQATLSLSDTPNSLEELDIPYIQVATGGQPYLEASMISEALEQLPLADLDMLLIEEIGTLTSPAQHSLGETLRVVVASLPEGEECPLRYPEPFAHADAIVLNKVDLLPVLGFDRDLFYRTLRRLNAAAPVFEISCRTGEGLEAWGQWLVEQVRGPGN
jgi:hydrogenase nickel incorporation protein HypB